MIIILQLRAVQILCLGAYLLEHVSCFSAYLWSYNNFRYRENYEFILQ